MVTVPNLIAELDHLSQWCEVQVAGGISEETIATHQYNALRGKISMLECIDIQSATSLSQKIQDIALRR